MKLLSILVLFFCLNSTINAQKQKDLVTITGKVSDYDGNPIGNCSVMFQNSNFDVLFETKTDENGTYQINIPKGKYSKTRPISDGFRKNNVNYWAFREIRSIIPHL